MNRIMRRLQHAHYRFGLAGLLPLAARRTRSALLNYRGRPWYSDFFDEEFDKSHGTDTAGRIELADLKTVPTDTKGFCYHYVPYSRHSFAKAIGKLPTDRSRYTFVDYGCGKGQALLLAAEHGFRKIVGVEFSPELCDAARQNAKIFKGSGFSDADKTVFWVDASTFQVPPGNCVLFSLIRLVKS